MMKKRILVPTILAGILGGFVLTQTQIFSSAEQAELLTATEAKALALKEFSGDIVEFDFDRDEAPHYEFEIINGTEKVELVIDAQSGAVLITEREAIKKNTPASPVLDEAPAVVDVATSVGTAVQNNVESAITTVENKTDAAVADVKIKTETAVQNILPPVAEKQQPVRAANENKATSISRAQAIAIAQSKASGTVVDVDYDDDDFEYDIKIKNGKTEYEIEVNAKTGAITKFEKDVDDDDDFEDDND